MLHGDVARRISTENMYNPSSLDFLRSNLSHRQKLIAYKKTCKSTTIFLKYQHFLTNVQKTLTNVFFQTYLEKAASSYRQDEKDMSFDYKLYAGICTSLNASILMKKIGIDDVRLQTV